MGRSLFIPFAIGGIVILGLVVGSIRTLVLERGQKKISARMMEKKRLRAVNSVGDGRQRIRVSRFQTMKFVESYTDAAQKREQEFRAMRRVQYCAERDRKWIALAVSTTAAFTLWLVGAAIFHVAEKAQGWTYFQTMYFTYTCLLTVRQSRELSKTGARLADGSSRLATETSPRCRTLAKPSSSCGLCWQYQPSQS